MNQAAKYRATIGIASRNIETMSADGVAILVIVLFTAIATPSADVVSMFMLAIPMVVLYFAAWFLAHLHDRRVARRNLLEFGEPV